MRNLSSRSSSVRPAAAAILLGAALVVTETAAPAAHAAPRLGHPGVARRVVRPRGYVRPPRRLALVTPPASVSIPLTDEVWDRLRRCESGGRYDINTGNGFYGAYQFVPRTWWGLGYSGMPHQAPPQVQDEAAQKLQARSGWGQWPVCSRRIGAR